MTSDQDQLRDFASRYTAAWCSQEPARVAEHYALEGSLTINEGQPSVGRAAITEAARSFMSTFPDMRVLMDDLVVRDSGSEYHWTLVSTNTGPGGTGNRVRISGFDSRRPRLCEAHFLVNHGSLPNPESCVRGGRRGNRDRNDF